jgi:hypothetical protein
MRKYFLTLLSVLSLFLPLGVAGQTDYQFPEAIKPLIKTHWGQNFPYNVLCPKTEKEDGTLVYNLAGCGSLAMAQMVNYHQYPSISPDGQYVYDWSLMFNSYQVGIRSERLVCVTKLICDCGASAFTEYSEVGSSTNMSAIMGAMKRLFRYTDEMGIYSRDDFTTPQRDSLFHQLIFSELQAGRPIIYRGYSSGEKGGHLFLLDGCKGDKVHVNMGWAGHRDGYYRLDDLGGYSKQQWMLVEVADSNYHPAYTDIRLDEAGTLADHLTPDQQLLTRHIRLSGQMNTDDFATLRKMLKEGLLRTIDMADADLETLPDSAFSDCTYLCHFIAPRRLRHTGNVTFFRCRNLNKIILPDGLETVGGMAFCGCNNLLEVRLPSTVRHILGNAYNSCEALLNVILPEGVETLGNYAFAHCSHLNSLHLPKSLQHIGQDVVNDCPRLKRFTKMTDEKKP